VLARWGFQVTCVTTNELIKNKTMFYRVLRVLIRSRGKRAAASNRHLAWIRDMLLSDAVLFGDSLIVVARKLALD
jgi:hypothetical protein